MRLFAQAAVSSGESPKRIMRRAIKVCMCRANTLPCVHWINPSVCTNAYQVRRWRRWAKLICGFGVGNTIKTLFTVLKANDLHNTAWWGDVSNKAQRKQLHCLLRASKWVLISLPDNLLVSLKKRKKKKNPCWPRGESDQIWRDVIPHVVTVFKSNQPAVCSSKRAWILIISPVVTVFFCPVFNEEWNLPLQVFPAAVFFFSITGSCLLPLLCWRWSTDHEKKGMVKQLGIKSTMKWHIVSRGASLKEHCSVSTEEVKLKILLKQNHLKCRKQKRYHEVNNNFKCSVLKEVNDALLFYFYWSQHNQLPLVH